MSDYKTPPPTEIHPDSLGCYDWLKEAPIAILCGRNNSGKSWVLRRLLRERAQDISYLGPARYTNFNILAPYGPQNDRKRQKWQTLLQHFQNQSHNVDNSPINLQQAIAELSDEQRLTLFEIVRDLLGATVGINHTISGNSMSQQYIDVDGYNLSYTSSGFRLIITLITSLLDRDYSHVLIDEPELGLSPEVQGVFADWLLDHANRAHYLKHVQGVVVATHSPIFLDRKELQNNVIVTRVGSTITLRRVESVQELNALQFRLLGNRFETLFLPSAIVLVEGKTDYAYLNRLIGLRAPQSTVSVVNATSDGRMREVIAIARQMLGDIKRSPYSDRIFVVLDAVHGHGLVDQLVGMGVLPQNIVVWDRNGVEYVYPCSILEEQFGRVDDLRVDGDVVTINGHSLTKVQLNDFVLSRLRGSESLPDELMKKLIGPLEKLVL